MAAQTLANPGPGTFSQTPTKPKNVATFGVKRSEKQLITPGPGSYNTIDADVTRRPATSTKNAFSMTQRPDLWQEAKSKVSNQVPIYNSNKGSFSNLSTKGMTIGQKRPERIVQTPGPGSYSNANVISMVKSTGASVRIGMTKRPDNFTRKEVVGLPGPGQHSTGDLTFGKGVKGLAKIKSAKMKPVRNDNPGPGQYTNDANKVKPTRSTAGKIGTT